MNLIRYTTIWLALGRPCRFGEAITVPASRRDRRRTLNEAKMIRRFEKKGGKGFTILRSAETSVKNYNRKVQE